MNNDRQYNDQRSEDVNNDRKYNDQRSEDVNNDRKYNDQRSEDVHCSTADNTMTKGQKTYTEQRQTIQ